MHVGESAASMDPSRINSVVLAAAGERDDAHSTQSDDHALDHEMAIVARRSITMRLLGSKLRLQHLGLAFA